MLLFSVFCKHLPILRSMATRRSSRLNTVTAQTNANAGPAPSTLGAQKAANGGKKRKSTAKDEDKSVAEPEDSLPSTPKRKRMAAKQLSSFPEAPTPGVTKLLSMYHGPGEINNVIRPPLIDRLAIPDGTNAQLVSPGTRRLVSTKPLDQVSPSKNPSGTTTTKNILDAALEHLIKMEPKLKPVIDKHPCNVFSEDGFAEVVDPFNSLVSGIISQQVRFRCE
jgi:DNA-3-methyladenine glycosylase II